MNLLTQIHFVLKMVWAFDIFSFVFCIKLHHYTFLKSKRENCSDSIFNVLPVVGLHTMDPSTPLLMLKKFFNPHIQIICVKNDLNIGLLKSSNEFSTVPVSSC